MGSIPDFSGAGSVCVAAGGRLAGAPAALFFAGFLAAGSFLAGVFAAGFVGVGMVMPGICWCCAAAGA
ncbi:MAG TPA: hypothetical protein VIZ66_06915, partial [Sphingomicrobium sp.]